MKEIIHKRCIALYSGGLDSILAIKLMEELGIEVIPLYFCTPFFGFEALRDPETFRKLHNNRFGIHIVVIDYTQDMIRIVNNPPHGFGKRFNPCIDCKIGMLKKASDLLKEMDASFVITGEVLGQRPMSQTRHTMRMIEKESGLQDILIRPLCAQNLPETLPERLGIVQRERFWNTMGRGRKFQIARAREYGITKEQMPTPAGGCLLTDEKISQRVKRTFNRFKPGVPEMADLFLDVTGRRFVLDDQTILVVGRDEKENDLISTFMHPGNMFLKIDEVPGPLCILRGNMTSANVNLAAGICLRYGKAKDISGRVAVYGPDPHHLDKSMEAPLFSVQHCRSFQD